MYKTNQTNNPLSRFARILMLLSAALCMTIGGCGLADTHSPYYEGYRYGYKLGEGSRNLGADYNIIQARDSASRYQYILNENSKGYKMGTPEYGDFIRGVEDGYFNGYR